MNRTISSLAALLGALMPLVLDSALKGAVLLAGGGALCARCSAGPRRRRGIWCGWWRSSRCSWCRCFRWRLPQWRVLPRVGGEPDGGAEDARDATDEGTPRRRRSPNPARCHRHPPGGTAGAARSAPVGRFSPSESLAAVAVPATPALAAPTVSHRPRHLARLARCSRWAAGLRAPLLRLLAARSCCFAAQRASARRDAGPR